MKNNFGSGDFRTARHKLPPEAFAVGPEEPDPSPQDLVGEEVWNSIISLPDDVSLRTSDNHGAEIKAMHELWASFIESLGNEQDIMWYAMLDVADELQASLYNCLCGYYRVAAACLRSVLELVTISAYFQLNLEPSEGQDREYLEWREGKRRVNFGEVCDHLQDQPRVRPIQEYISSKIGFSIFNQRSNDKRAGWARRLHSELSEFAHSRPSHSSARMWEGSNGPIYVPKSFGKVFTLYLDTIALGYVLIKLARPVFNLPSEIKYLFNSPRVLPSKVAVYAYEYLRKENKADDKT